MDRSAIQSFFDWLSDELLFGDFDWLEDVFLYPYSLFIDGEIRVETSPSQTLEYLNSRRKDVAAIGATLIKAKVLDIGKTRNARFPVRVKFVFQNATGETLAVNNSRYLCLLDERNRVRIESVDLTSVGVPFRHSHLINLTSGTGPSGA